MNNSVIKWGKKVLHRIYLIHSNTSIGMLPVCMGVRAYICVCVRNSGIANRNYYAKHHIQNMNGKELAVAYLRACVCQKKA